MPSTAEAVRDKDEAPAIPPMLARPEEPKAEAPAPAPAIPSFGDVVSGLTRMARDAMPSREEVTSAREKATAANDRAAKNASDRAAAFDASVDATKTEMRSYADTARANLPHAPQLPTPPSKGLRPFLATSPNEPPEASITKLITGLSTFAQMIGGGRAGARGALSAMTGALEGWKAGDKERADRHFADWKAQTETMLKQWDVELSGYETWLHAEGLPLEQRLLGLKLQAHQNGNHALADKITADNANEVFKELGERQTKALDYQRTAADLVGRKEEADRRHDERATMQQQLFEYRQNLLQAKHDQAERADKQAKEAVEGYTPQVLESLGQQWFLDPNGRMPVGAPRGKLGEMIRPKIVQAGLQWAEAHGIDPKTAPSVRAEIGAARSSATKLAGINAVQEGAIRRLDGHLDALIKLSAEVPRSEMPAVNDAILRGQKDYQGSPAAAKYVLQSLEVGMELSRVFVGTAQGDAATREEARKSIAGALTHEQVKAVADQMRQNAHRNIEMNKESLNATLDTIRVLEGAPTKATPASAPNAGGGTMQIRRKSDGKVFEGPKGAIPDGYEATT